MTQRDEHLESSLGQVWPDATLLWAWPSVLQVLYACGDNKFVGTGVSVCGQVCPSGGEQVCVWTGICVRADMNGNKCVCESSCVCVCEQVDLWTDMCVRAGVCNCESRYVCGQVCERAGVCGLVCVCVNRYVFEC